MRRARPLKRRLRSPDDTSTAISMRLITCLVAWALVDLSNGVSTKMEFGEEEPAVVTNTSKVSTEDEDVEVKHTIVVSTKLKNNNRRGVHSIGDDGEPGTLIGEKSPKNEDSGEVPIVYGTKGVETTRIHTPDTRHKTKIYQDAVFVNRNIRDEYDNVYPNVAFNPMQWKPSSFYNNINYRSQDAGIYNSWKNSPNPGKYYRKIAEEKAFYCRRCAELSNGQGLKGCSSVQQRSVNPWFVVSTTTPKMKIDGKLAKLN